MNDPAPNKASSPGRWPPNDPEGQRRWGEMARRQMAEHARAAGLKPRKIASGVGKGQWVNIPLPPDQPPPLNPQYRSVRFRASEPPGGWPVTFGVVTAWNPMDEDTSPEDNRAAHVQLEALVRENGFESFPVTGGSADMVHQEPGLGISNATENDAIALGRYFRQRAVFWIQDGALWLVSCVDGHRETLGTWHERLL